MSRFLLIACAAIVAVLVLNDQNPGSITRALSPITAPVAAHVRFKGATV